MTRTQRGRRGHGVGVFCFLFVCVTALHVAEAADLDVVINEILYHPPEGLQDAEFIELYNRGPDAVDLSGWRLADAVALTLPGGTSIAPGGYLLLVKNRSLASTLYPGVASAGNFSGSLSNGGERIRLVNAADTIIEEFDYSDADGWPEAADGSGASLEKLSPELEPWFADSWSSSVTLLGSPGKLNTTFRELVEMDLIQVGEDWSFFKGTSEPSATPGEWAQPGFDDSTWLVGPTGIGYADNDDATILDDMQGGYSTVYLRKSFDIADPGKVEELTAAVDYDDGFVLYLNGTEVARRNAGGTPGTPLAFDALAPLNHEAGRPEEIDLTAHASLLVAGSNVIAFHGINTTLESTDFSMAPALTVTESILGIETSLNRLVSTTVIPGGSLWRFEKGTVEPSAVLGDWTQPGFDDDLWFSGFAGFGYSDGDDATVLGDMQNGYTTLYLRKTFTVSEPAELVGMSLFVDYDDAFIAYLNGFEVARSPNAPGVAGVYQPAGALAQSTHEAGTEEVFDLGAFLGDVVAGDNVLAIHGFNGSIGSSDFSLHPRLSLLTAVEGDPEAILAGVTINEVHAPGDGSGWVEVHNGCSDPVDISGFGLSNTAADPLRYTIPASTIVPAGGFHVVSEAALGFALTLLQTLLLTDEVGVVLVDGRTFEIASPGLSVGSFPDGDDGEKTLASTTEGAANAAPPSFGVVINEIMYHPDSDPLLEELEWVELCNTTAAPVDLTGWRFTRGIEFDLPPGTMVPAGGYLVVARDPAGVQAEYGIAGVVGGYTSGLKNDDELVILRDHLQNVADRVHYADDGRWPTEADGAGPSLELIHPDLDNRIGHAWAASASTGTPGAQNSVFATSARPLVFRVNHSPPVPGDLQAVQVTATVTGLDPISEVRLFYRVAAPAGGPLPPFTQLIMKDDGVSGDGAAGDGVHGGTIPGQALGEVVEFFIEAEDAMGNVRVVPDTAPDENHLYIVDDPVADLGVPAYRVVMTPADRFDLESRSVQSDVLLNGSFVGRDDVFYRVGVRYRGKSSRTLTPKSYRVQFTDDEEFGDIKRLNLNANKPQHQHLGMNLFRGAGVPASLTRVVQFVFVDDPPLTYVDMEALDEDFLRRYYSSPDGEDDGNLYRGIENGNLDYRGENPDSYRASYEKKTNEDEDDWTDLIALSDTLTNTAEVDLPAVLPAVIDVDEWVRFFAVHTLLSTQEGGIYRDRGDDYFLYRRPSDGLWVLIPWDIDDSFAQPTERLFRPTLFQIRRILEHPAYSPSYYAHLVRLGASHFSLERMADRLDLLEDLFPATTLDADFTFVGDRLTFIDSRINTEFSVNLVAETIVAAGASWRFFRGTAEPSAGTLDWTNPSFDDSAWEVGPSGFGYGDGDDATVLDDMLNAYTTVYARHTFPVVDAAATPVLEFAANYDDGFIAFLNGVEIARANAGPGGVYPAFDALASGQREAGTFQTFSVDVSSILVDGDNVLAVVGLNATIDSSDFSLIPELRTGGVVGEACPGDFFITGASVNLSGLAPVTQTRFVRVDGEDSLYDPSSGEWSYSAPLGAGSRDVVVEVLDPGLSVVASETLNVTAVSTVGGAISEDTTWAAADGPFVVVGSVTVNAGVRLSIEPGCEFFIQENVNFSVSGEIQALGTEAAPILFTRVPCGENWGRIDINSRDENIFRNCEFERSNGSPGCLTVRSANLELHDCHIHHIAGEGVNAGGSRTRIINTLVERTNECLSLDFGDTVVEFSKMRNAIGKSDLCDANGSNNPPARIAFCTMHGTSDDGIDADQGGVIAEGNVIYNCGDQAISLVGAGNSRVFRNLCYENNHGLSVKNGHVCVAEFNTFVDNNQTGVRGIQKSSGQPGGIITLKNSIVWGNGTPLFVNSTGEITTTYSDVEGDLVPGAGNINVDPLFVNAGADDYRLQAASPCIGAADNGDDMGALPFEIAPRAPSALQVISVSSEAISLGWKDNSFVEEGFDLERRVSTGFAPSFVIQEGDQWRFFRGTAEPAAGTLDWTTLEFDDSTWEEGPSGLGYGDGDDATLLGDMQNGYSTVYARREFNIADAGGIQSLELLIDHDDAFVAYLNGVEITRQQAGLPGLFLAFDSLAAEQHEAGTPVSIEFSTDGILQTGVNVLAIQGLNVTLDSSDFSLIPELRTTDPAPFAPLATLPPNSRGYVDAGLSGATIYSYRVRSFNASGSSSYSNIVTQETVNIPAGPSNLILTGVDETSISMAWTDNSDVEDEFQLERSEAGGDFVLHQGLPADTRSFDDTGLTPGVVYAYRVRATNAFGASPYSNTLTQVTGVAPAAPGNLTVSAVFADALELTWEDNSDNETLFEVQGRFGDAGAFQTRAIVDPDVTTYLDDELTSGQVITYRVRAINDIGPSGFSNEVTGETGGVPASPTDLTVSAVTLDSVTLIWMDESGNEDGFEVERLAPGDPDFQALTALGPDATTYTDSGLDEGTDYSYRVRATNVFGPSAYSNVVVATTARTPVGPSGLNVTDFGLDTVDLAWLDNSDNETGFELERREGAGAFVKIADLPPGSVAYSDVGLDQGTTYGYRIRAVTPLAASSYSAEVGVTTGRLPDPPSALRLVDLTHESVSFSWQDNSDNEDSFEVDRSEAGGAFVTVAQVSRDGTTFLDVGLLQGTEYLYRVRALNAFGSSVPSSSLMVTTGELPVAPEGLVVTSLGLTEVGLAWADTANETGYELERRSGAGIFAKVADLAADSTAHVDGGLSQGTEYAYRLRAVNDFGVSGYSAVVTARTARLPESPSGLEVLAVDLESVTIGWVDNADNETGFEVERRSGGGPFETVGFVPADVVVFDDAGLATGVEYVYRVRAVSDFGASGYTVEVAVTTGSSPAAPGGLAVDRVGLDNVTLVWTDNADNEAEFELERSDAGGAFTVVATPPANTTSFTDGGLSPGADYAYRLLAVNEFGRSAPSNEVLVMTGALPATPTDLVVLGTTTDSVEIGWTDVAINETAYEVERLDPGGSSFSPLASLPAGSTGLLDNGLEPGASYEYRVRAVNEFGASNHAGPIVARTVPLDPEILSVEPAAGPSRGGTAVVIRGGNFLADSQVTLGGRALAGLVVVDETEIRGTTPEGERGSADVVVTTSSGQATLAGGFAYFDEYLRGDANADGSRNLSDAVRLLRWLFSDQPGPPCEDVVLINNDDEPNLTDAIFLLTFLFRGGLPPEPDKAQCF